MLIDDIKLTQYALGILEDGEQKAVQREIATTPALQKQLSTIRNSLQPIALAEKPISPSAGLRNLVMESTQDKTRFAGFIERFANLFDLDTLTSKKLLAKIDDAPNNVWESTPFPGITIMKFAGGPRVSTATSGIVQVKTGKLFPAHQHQGDEMNLVLQGFARDDKNRVLSAGDMFNFHAGSSHSFRAFGNETFIFAVVLYKDNKWLLIKTLINYLRIK